MSEDEKDQLNSAPTRLRQARKTYTDSQNEIIIGTWGWHNAPVKGYEDSFKNVLEGQRLVDLISNSESPIVLDIMAPPRTLYDLQQQRPTIRRLSVSLPDHEMPDSHPDYEEWYKEGWLPADVTKASTWRQIDEWLGGNKADLILERAVAGLYQLPKNKKLLGLLLNKLWSRLRNDGGVLLFETHSRDFLLNLGIDLDEWVKNLQAEIEGVKYDPGIPNSGPRYETAKIMITRTPNSPSLLPSIES